MTSRRRVTYDPPSADSQVVQELHLVSVHVMCEYLDRTLAAVVPFGGILSEVEVSV